MDLLDYIESAKARDIGIAQTLAKEPPPWLDRALGLIVWLPKGWSGLGENIREMVLEQIGPPHSPHCYGALINVAIRKGLLEHTGGMKHMRAVRSHARLSPVLRRA